MGNSRYSQTSIKPIRDRDGSFGSVYTRRIRAMEIRDHPTAPRSPWQNGHVDGLHHQYVRL
jgi:hypothetical protein